MPRVKKIPGVKTQIRWIGRFFSSKTENHIIGVEECRLHLADFNASTAPFSGYSDWNLVYLSKYRPESRYITPITWVYGRCTYTFYEGYKPTFTSLGGTTLQVTYKKTHSERESVIHGIFLLCATWRIDLRALWDDTLDDIIVQCFDLHFHLQKIDKKKPPHFLRNDWKTLTRLCHSAAAVKAILLPWFLLLEPLSMEMLEVKHLGHFGHGWVAPTDWRSEQNSQKIP